MNLRESTRDIISQVKSLTGFPVEVIEDDSLQTTAVVQMASRRTLPVHLIRYKATAGQFPDYLICHQCGYILRQFARPQSASRSPTRLPDMTRSRTCCSPTGRPGL